MTRRRVAADAALTIAMAAVITVCILLRQEDHTRAPDLVAHLLGLGIAALVPLRRRRPLGVLLGSTALLVLYHVLGYPATGLAIPLSVALYAAAAGGRAAWVFGVVAVQVLGGSWYRYGVEGEPAAALLSTGSLADAALMVSLVLLGDAVRSRRALTGEVAERLRREADRRVAEERLRIARELHDVLAHTVAVITVQAGVAGDVLDDDPGEARRALRAIRAASREALAELSATVGVLRGHDPAPTAGAARGGHDPALAAGTGQGPGPAAAGLAAAAGPGDTSAGHTWAGHAAAGRATALHAAAGPDPGDGGPAAAPAGLAGAAGLVARARAAGLAATLVVEGDGGPLPPAVDLTAYRIVQESVTNVPRHAAATAVEVRLTRGCDAVAVTVTDDGTGSGLVPGSGDGLTGMPPGSGPASSRPPTAAARSRA